MFKKLSESMDLLAVITIVATFSYFVGWAYTWGYFSRIGIQYESLNLSPAYYLSQAVFPFLFILMAILAINLIRIILIKFNKQDVINTALTMRTSVIFSSIVLILVLSFLSSMFIGEFVAEQKIEGESNQAFIVNFSWKETSPKELQGMDLILIMHRSNKYYVVNKQNPAPEYPEVYVIPDNQIKFAVIKKIQPA